jgi:SET domain-containing protein
MRTAAKNYVERSTTQLRGNMQSGKALDAFVRMYLTIKAHHLRKISTSALQARRDQLNHCDLVGLLFASRLTLAATGRGLAE